MIVTTFEVWCYINSFLNKYKFNDEDNAIETSKEEFRLDKKEFNPDDFLKQFDVSKSLMEDFLQILKKSLENIFQKSIRKYSLLKGLEETYVTATPNGKGNCLMLSSFFINKKDCFEEQTSLVRFFFCQKNY